MAPTVLGQGGASAEDEDWLSLDNTPPAAATGGSDTVSAQPVAPSGTLPADDEDPFVSDDPFTLEPVVERPTADNPFDSLPDLSSFGDQFAGSNMAASHPGNAEPPVEYEDDFRVRCPVCESMISVTASQSGKTIKCGDCHSDVRIGKPPRKKQKQSPSLETAATFRFSEAKEGKRPSDPMQRSAEQLLAEASREEPDEEQQLAMAFDAPSMVDWLKSVFGIFLDVGVLVHLLGLSVILAVPAAVISPYPKLSILLLPLGLLGTTLAVSCGFAILFSVANDADRVEDWPTVDPASWFDMLWLVIAATAISVGPAYVISTVFAATPIMTLSLVMFCVFTAFPIILLSMLDMETVTMPFSADVAKSLTRCQDDWGVFYFATGSLFAMLFGYFIFCPETPIGLGIGIVLAIVVVFLYFAILGRLAVAISGVVELGSLESPADDEEPAA
ncbi:hypothetical protein [Rhodopirellula sp. MGV]|uniref:hypothetical protein n=1 Tax=Rhodopirellula sp. MGV TaxID=2023130 RepID=UPI001179D841|nr:hypothetical protein [Rhodopirellula sp. MGV]